MHPDGLGPGGGVLGQGRHPAVVGGPVYHLFQPLCYDGLVVNEHNLMHGAHLPILTVLPAADGLIIPESGAEGKSYPLTAPAVRPLMICFCGAM